MPDATNADLPEDEFGAQILGCGENIADKTLLQAKRLFSILPIADYWSMLPRHQAYLSGEIYNGQALFAVLTNATWGIFYLSPI